MTNSSIESDNGFVCGAPFASMTLIKNETTSQQEMLRPEKKQKSLFLSNGAKIHGNDCGKKL
jgi:hypothetical protein